MGQWKLWFVLFLQLTLYVDSRDAVITETRQQLVKTIGRETDMTRICPNTTEQIVLIVCWIRTERRGEDCRLLYRYGEDFVHECDSRFTLMMENQTVFLHLTNLTPVDSGSYTCQCSLSEGVYTLHLNITVQEEEDTSNSTQIPQIPPIPLHHGVIIGVPISIFMIITGTIMGFICRKYKHRRSEPLSSPADTEPAEIEPYRSYLQRENELYSLVQPHHSGCSLGMTQI